LDQAAPRQHPRGFRPWTPTRGYAPGPPVAMTYPRFARRLRRVMATGLYTGHLTAPSPLGYGSAMLGKRGLGGGSLERTCVTER